MAPSTHQKPAAHLKSLFLLGFEMRQGEQSVNDKPLGQFRLRSAYQ
jgi:hypothetical protein